MNDYHSNIEKTKEAILVGSSPRRYICEVHREIYDFLEKHVTDKNELEEGLNLLAEAFYMGKRMSDRISEFKGGNEWIKDEIPPNNKDFEDDLFRRAQRLNLLNNIKSIQIQTIDYCNLKCSWCPNSKLDKSSDTLMTYDVLTRILRQLIDYNYKGDIHPFLMGEPSTDKRMPNIIAECKKMLPKNHLRIITNGVNLRTKESLREYFDAGCDSMHMNHYFGPFENIKKARDLIFPRLTHFGMQELRPTFYNRAGHVNEIPNYTVDKCDWFLNKLYFRYNGDLILCCSDYNYEVIFGNIMENPLASILNSKLYREYYYAHKEGRGKEMPLCKNCNRLK